MDIVDPRIEAYTASLHARYDEPAFLEMEAEGRELGFPIVGRNVGVTLGRSPPRSALVGCSSWARASVLGLLVREATGAEGEIHLTDGDAANERKAADYLGRAGAWERITYHVGDALTSFAAVDGDFDVVYDDIDKHGYPDAWRAARDRVRIGGPVFCDNTLWYGRVLRRRVAGRPHRRHPRAQRDGGGRRPLRDDDPADPRRRAGGPPHVDLAPCEPICMGKLCRNERHSAPSAGRLG